MNRPPQLTLFVPIFKICQCPVGRYIHHSTIADTRIVAYNGERVTLYYKNRDGSLVEVQDKPNVQSSCLSDTSVIRMKPLVLVF